MISFWPELQKTGLFVLEIPDVDRKKEKMKRKKKRIRGR